MKIYIYIIALTILFLSRDSVTAKSFNENVDMYMKMSSDELIDRAENYMYLSDKADSALLCYTIVVNRYSEDMELQEKIRCIEALIGEWYVYFFIHYDYNKSYESLVKAREIASSIDTMMPEIDMYLGCMYQAFAEQSKDAFLYNMAYKYFGDAIEGAIKDKNEKVMNISFTNLLSVADDISLLDNINDLWKKYDGYNFKDSNKLIEYNKMFYRGLVYAKDNKYEAAARCYDSMIKMMTGERTFTRFVLIASVKKADMYIRMNNSEKSLRLLDNMMNICDSAEIKDARLIVYDLYGKIYRKMGDYKKMEENRDRYFSLKDSLLSYRQIAAINKVHFANEIKSIDDKYMRLKIKNDFQTKMVYLESVFILIILASIVIVIRKNKQLKKSNRELYNKNVQLIRSEDKEKEICKKYKEQNPEIQTEISSPCQDKDINDEERVLLTEILKIMDDTEMVCSFNFTLDKLSVMVDSKPRQVSELISKVYDCNFNSFVGTYRIKEACRRFEDVANYGNLTIEGVGNSVGFKSRSNFVATFKKFTGLAPSKYKQMSESEN